MDRESAEGRSRCVKSSPTKSSDGNDMRDTSIGRDIDLPRKGDEEEGRRDKISSSSTDGRGGGRFRRNSGVLVI